MRARAFVRAALAAALVLGGAAQAAFPERTIRVIVPFATGGATDALGRAVCEVLSLDLKQTCIVENKPGAGTGLANAFVSSSPPDGHTLLITTSAFSDEARQYAAGIDSKLALIDGAQLADLMIDFDLGVSPASTYTVKRIDSDFFGEE